MNLSQMPAPLSGRMGRIITVSFRMRVNFKSANSLVEVLVGNQEMGVGLIEYL